MPLPKPSLQVQQEIGVAKAAKQCVPRYLPCTLALSPAAVIVILGGHARQAFRRTYVYPDADVVSQPLIIEGTERRIVFLSHPEAREGGNARPLKYPKRLDPDDRDVVRAVLNSLPRASTAGSR